MALAFAKSEFTQKARLNGRKKKKKIERKNGRFESNGLSVPAISTERKEKVREEGRIEPIEISRTVPTRLPIRQMV